MIGRFDVSCNLTAYESGRYVLYKDHLAEIADLKAENERLRSALVEITDYPEERLTCEIADKALEEVK